MFTLCGRHSRRLQTKIHAQEQLLYLTSSSSMLHCTTALNYWNGAGSFSERRRANFCQMSPSSTPRSWAFVIYSIKLQALGSTSALAITWAKSIRDTDVMFLFIFHTWGYTRNRCSQKAIGKSKHIFQEETHVVGLPFVVWLHLNLCPNQNCNQPLE